MELPQDNVLWQALVLTLLKLCAAAARKINEFLWLSH
jgi:hypothetical protein